MPNREERVPGAKGPEAPRPRLRPANVFRALVVAAVAAAAPLAGCYQSGPDEDASDAAAEDGSDARDAADDGMMPAYGVPDAGDDSVARYAVPLYGMV
jgi:hypothetical protein